MYLLRPSSTPEYRGQPWEPWSAEVVHSRCRPGNLRMSDEWQPQGAIAPIAEQRRARRGSVKVADLEHCTSACPGGHT